MKPANDVGEPRVRYPLEDPRGDDGMPPVTLEVFVTLDEWCTIRQRHEELAPRPSAFYDAVGEVLGERVRQRMIGDVIGFRPLPLGAAPPSFEERFAAPQTR